MAGELIAREERTVAPRASKKRPGSIISRVVEVFGRGCLERQGKNGRAQATSQLQKNFCRLQVFLTGIQERNCFAQAARCPPCPGRFEIRAPQAAKPVLPCLRRDHDVGVAEVGMGDRQAGGTIVSARWSRPTRQAATMRPWASVSRCSHTAVAPATSSASWAFARRRRSRPRVRADRSPRFRARRCRAGGCARQSSPGCRHSWLSPCRTSPAPPSYSLTSKRCPRSGLALEIRLP